MKVTLKQRLCKHAFSEVEFLIAGLYPFMTWQKFVCTKCGKIKIMKQFLQSLLFIVGIFIFIGIVMVVVWGGFLFKVPMGYAVLWFLIGLTVVTSCAIKE
jgi:fatty acid desaturase